MLTISIFLLMALEATLSHPDEVKAIITEYVEDHLPIQTVEAEALKAASIALERFARRRDNIACFKTDIYKEDDGWRIAFVGKQPSDGTFFSSYDHPCGGGVSYVVNKQFEVVSEIFSR